MKKTPLEDWIVNRTGISVGNKEKLETYQLEKILETLDYAIKMSAFYKKKLAGVNLKAIKSLSDFKKLPFTFPEDIAKTPFELLCVSQTKVDRIVTLNTSGTSGAKKRIFFTETDLSQTVDFFDYGMRSLTDNTDRVLVLLPGKAYGSIGDLLKKALLRSGTSCTVLGLLTDLDEAEKVIEEQDINCIVGIPIQILYLSRRKSDVFSRKIEKVLLSTDYVPEVLINELNNKFDCRVFNHYGMTEMGYGCGVECEALSGYHLREGDMYIEIINPDSGEPVEDGQYGEIVYTSFNREAMPLIRYRTGDIAAFSNEACACGTFLRTLKKAEGRLSNRIEFGKNLFFDLKLLEEMILSFEEVMDYQVTLEENTTLTIGISLYNQEDERQIKEQLSDRIRDYFWEDFQLSMLVNININQEQRPDQLVNSMVKRKIDDQRKGKTDE